MDHRRDRRRVVARVAQHVLVGEPVEELEERLAHRLLHEQARAGEADLPRVVVLPGRLAGRRLEVAVLEDEERPLPAELARERRDVARGSNTDRAGGLGRARERDPPHVRVLDERSAHLLADPLHDVEHPRRKARLGREVGEERAGERRPLRRLQHDRASRRERRSRLPGREHEGSVPRRDHDRRPTRHAQDPVVRTVRVPHALLVGDREIGVAPEVPRAAGDHPRPQRAEQHRHVGALDRGETLDVTVDQVAETVEDLGTARRPQCSPGGERLGRGRDRERRLPRAAPGDLCQRLLVDRRDVGEARVARDPLAADPVVGRDGHPSDLDPAAHPRRSRSVARSSTV